MALVKHKYRLKDGTTVESTDWYYRFIFRGKRYFGTTETSNKTIAARVQKKKQDELVAQKELGDSPGITIEKALKTYLDSTVKSGQHENNKTQVSKLMGRKRNSKVSHEEWIEVFGFDKQRQFSSLIDADVQMLILKRREEGNADSTILNELVVLNQTIKLNKHLGMAVPNISFAELKRTNALKPAKTKLRYLSDEEEQRLLRELDPANIVNGVAFGAMTDDEIIAARQDNHDFAVCLLDLGCRYSELSTLEYRAVNLNARTIRLFRSKVNNETVFHMTDRVFDVLSRRHQTRRKGQVHVFENKERTGPRNYSRGWFDRARKRAGIEGVSAKTCRKTYASRLVQAGVPLKNVSQMLGHSSTQTTEKHYAFLAPNQASAEVAQILNRINKGGNDHE